MFKIHHHIYDLGLQTKLTVSFLYLFPVLFFFKILCSSFNATSRSFLQANTKFLSTLGRHHQTYKYNQSSYDE